MPTFEILMLKLSNLCDQFFITVSVTHFFNSALLQHSTHAPTTDSAAATSTNLLASLFSNLFPLLLSSVPVCPPCHLAHPRYLVAQSTQLPSVPISPGSPSDTPPNTQKPHLPLPHSSPNTPPVPYLTLHSVLLAHRQSHHSHHRFLPRS
mmetsp:Transcript_58759/g.155463  ORF Transcript_58759/g.155463 Transcript_58759/m.155463 type:complete len:150 (-) Transcript_58759:762-1211(-)